MVVVVADFRLLWERGKKCLYESEEERKKERRICLKEKKNLSATLQQKQQVFFRKKIEVFFLARFFLFVCFRDVRTTCMWEAAALNSASRVSCLRRILDVS